MQNNFAEYMAWNKVYGGSGGGGGGGGSSAETKDVNFYDYDGTVVASYTAQEFAELPAMPDNPSHSDLVAQGWNWSLEDAKGYVAKYGMLDVGQSYTTESGKTEIDISLPDGRTDPLLGVRLNGTIEVDWGDGSTDTLTGTSTSNDTTIQHTYASPGDYTIKIGLISGSYRLVGAYAYTFIRKNTYTDNNENDIYRNMIKAIRFSTDVSMVETVALYHARKIETVTLPNTITALYGNCFVGCWALKCIILPQNCSINGYSNFQECYGMKTVVMSKGVTSISNNMFNSCRSLGKAIIPDSVTLIDGNAFASCNGLEKVIIPDSVVTVNSNSFQETALREVEFPDSVTRYNSSIFYMCKNLESAKLKGNVVQFAGSIFNSCYNLKYVTFPSGITEIPSSMFAGCCQLRGVVIPAGVTHIRANAFNGCYCLGDVTLPESLVGIEGAFVGCYDLADITIPSGVTSIASNAFNQCYGLKKIHMLPTTPPTLGTNGFNNIPSDCVIYVPAASLADYQAATNWSTYASQMRGE